MKRILGYIAVFFFTVYCFFIYDDEILRTMLVLEVLYFVASIAFLFMNRNISAKFISFIPVAEKNKELPINVLVQNKKGLFDVHFNVVLRIQNLSTGDVVKYKARDMVKRRSEKRVTIPLYIQESGNIKITLGRLEIFDYLFILMKKIKIKETKYISVLPECHLLQVEVSKKTRDFIADADEYSDRESGDDSSEIYKVREYRIEDSIHDIHWKLSAKADELLVKEYGRPLGSTVLIWLDMAKRKNKASTNRNAIYKRLIKRKSGKKDSVADILEIVASLSMSLLEEECVHMVAWYEPKNNQIYKKRISKDEHLYELLYRLLYVEMYDENEEVQVQLEEAFRGVYFSTTVKVKSDRMLYCGDEIIDIPEEKGQINWEQLFIRV